MITSRPICIAMNAHIAHARPGMHHQRVRITISSRGVQQGRLYGTCRARWNLFRAGVAGRRPTNNDVMQIPTCVLFPLFISIRLIHANGAIHSGRQRKKLRHVMA